jgi:hypothetical protein
VFRTLAITGRTGSLVAIPNEGSESTLPSILASLF